jgi:predicted permease
MNEIKHAFRQLVLRPGLSVTVIVMLALGIGATTAIFSLFYQVLIQPLPVPEPGRLVSLSLPGGKPGSGRTGLAVNNWDAAFSYPMFRDLEAKQQVFTGVAAHYDFLVSIGSGERATFGGGTLVSGRYFDVLGVRPALGRLIGPQDEPSVGESEVAVLSYDYWQRQYGGDPGILNKTLPINGRNLTIVGVAAKGFDGAMLGWKPQVYVPLTMRWLMQPEEPRDDENRFSYWVYILARLKPDVSLEQASAAMNVLFSAVTRESELPLAPNGTTEEQKARFLNRKMLLEPGGRGQSNVPGQAGAPLTLLLGITTLLLLIVCVNIANLLLARGAARAGELAIRTSVGASRGRLAGQLLAEAAVLALLGAFASVPVAAVTLRFVASLSLTSNLAVALSVPALVFGGAAALATLLVFGLAPAIQASRTDLASIIKGQAAQSRGGRGVARFNRALITVQIAFATILLVLAGLFTRSLINVARLDLGMAVESVASFSVSPLLAGHAPDALDAVYDRVQAALAAEPGVRSVGSGAIPILGNFTLGANVVSVDGVDLPPNTNADTYYEVSPRFFESFSVPLLAGRDFSDSDRTNPAVAIVNEALAKKLGLGNDAVGKHVRVRAFYAPSPDLEIIGVVGDTRLSGVKRDLAAQIFLPRPRGDKSFSSLFFFVRSELGADSLLSTIPRVVASVDPNMPVGNLSTVKRWAENNVSQDRVVTILSTTLAALATVLAAIGLYGVLAYSVAQRTRELGLRLALGAQPSTLRAMVLKQVGVIALVGTGLGLAAALAVGRFAAAMLYGLSSYDPTTLGAAIAILAVVVLGSAYIPARRASTVAPLEALRYE